MRHCSGIGAYDTRSYILYIHKYYSEFLSRKNPFKHTIEAINHCLSSDLSSASIHNKYSSKYPIDKTDMGIPQRD